MKCKRGDGKYSTIQNTPGLKMTLCLLNQQWILWWGSRVGFPAHSKVPCTPSPTHCGTLGDGFTVGSRTSTIMLSLEGRHSAPSAFTTPECHSWTSPFGSHSSSITKPQTQCEQRNCKDYGRCPGVYLGFPCTSCCSARTLAWPIMNNYTRYFLLESSARSSLQRWILERLLCHQSSDKGKSLSVYRHLLDICCDFLNILFLWRIHSKTYL